MKIYALRYLLYLSLLAVACQTTQEEINVPISIKNMSPDQAQQLADDVISKVAIQKKEGLTIDLWAGDTLMADPIALDIDEQGRVYITRTQRNSFSEFDIRGHRDWEIGSISLQSVEDRRKFLLRELSPDSSDVNDWLEDLNGDGSRDCKDITIEKEQVYRLEDTDGDGYALSLIHI